MCSKLNYPPPTKKTKKGGPMDIGYECGAIWCLSNAQVKCVCPTECVLLRTLTFEKVCVPVYRASRPTNDRPCLYVCVPF